jgi:hypothetical protein
MTYRTGGTSSGVQRAHYPWEVERMVTVELTKREADALDEAIRLGDTEDVEALRTAIDKLWIAADAQQHGDTWRILYGS